MYKLIFAAVVATSGLAAVPANAFERHFTVETNRGTITGTVEGHCYKGACTRDAEITGPNGKTYSRVRLCVRQSKGVWDCKATVTGPKGGTAESTGSITIN